MRSQQKPVDAVIMGAAIADILLRPVDESVFSGGSIAVEDIRLSLGGDALNEATVLARLGHAPMLISTLGRDAAAGFIQSHCEREGVTLCAPRKADMDTGINAVLVMPSGERSFVTSRNGSLRKLTLDDIEPFLQGEVFAGARVACLASMLVSPPLDVSKMRTLFERIKAAGKILCADTTRPKNGETLSDLAGALQYVDYFFPNITEARALSGLTQPDEAADAILNTGVRNVVIKLGRAGCLIKNAHARYAVPAYPQSVCVDTTGAGDTFAAAFIAALLEGRPLSDCGAYANAAASLCVERLGATAAAMDREEIERRFRLLLPCIG